MKGFGDNNKSNPKNTNKKSELKRNIFNQALIFHSQGKILEAAKYYRIFIDNGFYDELIKISAF